MDTLRHHGRVAETGRILGRALGLNSEALGLLVDCAARHDVGKQFIPRDILHKPGPLDPSEWDVMKGHTWRGAEYLVERTEVNESWLIALTHHERFDGRGYPFGLCGTDIPLFSRIVSLADMFDALISERCYKPAYSVSLSLDIIRSERGHRFDPCIVDVFFAHIDEVGCMN